MQMSDVKQLLKELITAVKLLLQKILFFNLNYSNKTELCAKFQTSSDFASENLKIISKSMILLRVSRRMGGQAS